MNDTTKPQVRFITVDVEDAGQRIDNFLLKTLKGVPKSMIYRLLRKGEIRVNKKRTKPDYKLKDEDVLRIAPIRVSEKSAPVSTQLNVVANLEKQILFEDDRLIVINKPSGMAVHGGSGVNFGLIEALRALRPDARMLELVHRLDRDTSGCLVVAKKRSALRNLHEQLRNKKVQKFYHALVKGRWSAKITRVTEGLKKNDLKSGERIVVVDNINGKESETRFKVIQHYKDATLVRAFPVTGRTHQIRVHCQTKGHPIACDAKYGHPEFDAQMKAHGLDRLFLHAASIEFTHPLTEKRIKVEAPLAPSLDALLSKLTVAKTS
ncbi:23S rRNA pseudouridine(955/2504/2580) synthase RluC [Thalassotalea sp. 1_MG-2023]|uniref:23S rRNA pseudouridine(955/2504/2580) synthase RluC n=1 Tax=Thalassotalea sp. 1_MG-2023 TaxID=3062680 RepID=UPI0026E3641A|nr:23S rRNA pseudouridine(955/2504/2580) synthase RluC [Thalassotalea sp. 1_MG-2023]MDO6427786.1 23S rRNA pseudouridine(955/2504/2580) synthase RluC [Thalassotalea sp. 1_MG-2023]